MKMDVRPAVLATDHLTVQVGRRDVVRALDFTLQPGDTLAILGRNGAGKTTLLHSPRYREMRSCGSSSIRRTWYQ